MREMKDSGVEWIGEVPKKWIITKFKYYVSLYTGNSIKDDEKDNYIDSVNAHPYIATKDINAILNTVNYNNGLFIKNDDDRFKIALTNSTLMCIEGGSAGKKKAKIDREVSFVNKLCCFYSDIINNGYLYYFVSSPNYETEFINNITGLIGGVSVSILKNLQILLPQKEEQYIIANYLDNKCSKIDIIIEKQQTIIEKLKEYKLSLITETVIKGLNPNVEMKDSGIEWIDKIPMKWKKNKIKFCCKFSPNCNLSQFSEDITVTFTPMEYIKNGYFINNKEILSNLNGSYNVYLEGDIVIAKVTPCFENGNIAIMKGLYSGIGFGSSELFVIRSISINTKYLFYFLQNEIFKQMACSTMSGVGGLKRVSSYFIQNYIVTVPPQEEQQKIASFLDKKCTTIENSIQKKQNIIDKLTEYKKSLIYEVVTGKMEV